MTTRNIIFQSNEISEKKPRTTNYFENNKKQNMRDNYGRNQLIK